jgi:acrylyl-CoA reductase (NADPH)
LSKLDAVAQEISLVQAINKAPEVLAGKIRGRLVVNLQN